MFCGSLDVRGVCTQVYVFLKPFSVHLKLSQYCWLATLQCKIKSEKEVKIWKKGCTHAWYYYYHVLAYRQGILGITQTLLSLFLPILKHIYYFYSLLPDLEHRLIAILSLLCRYPKFHEGSPGRPKQLWEENVKSEVKVGDEGKPGSVTEI